MQAHDSVTLSSQQSSSVASYLLVQPTSLQPTSLQPTSLQPTSLQPTSLQPTSLQPTSLPNTQCICVHVYESVFGGSGCGCLLPAGSGGIDGPGR